MHFTSHSWLNPCFQLSCKCATVTSESCSVCSCFLSTASHFCTKFQSCYPSCFQNSFSHYQFNAFSLFSLMLSKLCRSSCSKCSPLCTYLFPNASFLNGCQTSFICFTSSSPRLSPLIFAAFEKCLLVCLLPLPPSPLGIPKQKGIFTNFIFKSPPFLYYQAR